jgi:hypothetical protein
MSAGGSSVSKVRASLAEQVAAVGDLQIEADRRRLGDRGTLRLDFLEIAARVSERSDDVHGQVSSEGVNQF